MSNVKIDFNKALVLPAGAVAPGTDPGFLRSLGIVVAPGGSERGYNAVGDLLGKAADGTDLNDLWAEYQDTVRLANATRNVIIDFLTFGVTQEVERVAQAGSGADFEIATEYGEPKGVRTKVGYFNLGYDLEWYDLAARFTWQYLAEADRSAIDAVAAAALEADNRNIFNKVMRTVFNPTNLTTTIDGNSVPVYKFYNNDGTTPPAYKSNTFTNTHTHYVGSGNTLIDSGDLEAIQNDFYSHGYTKSGGYRLVLMVNKAQGDAIRTWRFGVENANSAVAKFDFIPARGREDLLFLTQTQVLGNQVADNLEGLDVIGSYGDFTIVQEDYIPSGYIFAFATGGAQNLGNPIGFREHRNTGLRGLRLVKGRDNDYPLIDSFYQRVFGTGIRQRGGGYVMQIVNSATYTAPSLYL